MKLAPELRALVRHTLEILGDVLRQEKGGQVYRRIERIRRGMAGLRGAGEVRAKKTLHRLHEELADLPSDQLVTIARAFTLMLELMNACENAYRSHRIKHRARPIQAAETTDGIEAVVYVLTAHPTEARSPSNIEICHQIQNLLIRILDNHPTGPINGFSTADHEDLFHLILIAWKTFIVRRESPTVADEAAHVYSLALRSESMAVLLDSDDRQVPLYLRSWVGGDKDGHPGVNQAMFLESLRRSRSTLVRHGLELISEVRGTLSLTGIRTLSTNLDRLEKNLHECSQLRTRRDGRRLRTVRALIHDFAIDYTKAVGSLHPSLRRLETLLRLFPALVIPLEMRESSDVLTGASTVSTEAIQGMLTALRDLSDGGDARWYVRGFIVSMTESVSHLEAAALLQRRIFGRIPIPVIPLFETPEALDAAEDIVRDFVRSRQLKSAAKQQWDGLVEIMVGYSDSSKLGGVLPSRVGIAKALPKIEGVCLKAGLQPVFFHGSGGSIDRGGGSIEDQIAWWPRSALRRYKVTVQGEMVERSFASEPIARGQVDKIISSANKALRHPARGGHPPALVRFAENVRQAYSEKIHQPELLRFVEYVTTYSYLDVLRIGSRPSKRADRLSVDGLRAIPWVLCWTQARLLLPTWWGVGHAWSLASAREKAELRRLAKSHPVLQSYVKALGFTLAKIENPVWEFLLESSDLDTSLQMRLRTEIRRELRATRKFLRDVTGTSDPVWFRPWLAESIRLRSPMIHPLNVLQKIAQHRRHGELLRLTVTGISSGMMTTG